MKWFEERNYDYHPICLDILMKNLNFPSIELINLTWFYIDITYYKEKFILGYETQELKLQWD